MMTPHPCALRWNASLLLTAASLCGCASQSGTGTPSQSAPAASVTTPSATAHRAGATQSVQVVTGVLPLGSVPYDGMMLPLVSPDGRFIATQSGASPTWPTVLAESESELPLATRIEIYEIDWREGINPKDRQPPRLIHAISHIVLGRSADAEGFLIESHRDDGSRWIGKVGWRSNEVQWLVADDSINAFASLGPQGRLAWSRRSFDGETFELVVRHDSSATGDWVVRADDEHWLFPTWSGRGDGLFVFHLKGGVLELQYGKADSPASFQQSKQRLHLASESVVHTAYQSIIGQPVTIDGSLPMREQIVFYHPSAQRMAVWRPLAPPDRQGIYLNARSVAALVDEEDFAFISTDRGLLRQNLRVAAERLELSEGIQVPRPLTRAAWPFMLLSPIEGQINLRGLRLLPREEGVFRSRLN